MQQKKNDTPTLSLSGVQMVALDYDFTSRAPFTEDDVASLYPIVKQTNFRVSGNFTDIIYTPLLIELARPLSVFVR